MTRRKGLRRIPFDGLSRHLTEKPFVLEGAICILVSLPLAVPLGALGGLLAYSALHFHSATRGATMLLLLPPASLHFDTTARPPVFEVRSSLTIDAPPEVVWQHVVTFSDLAEPSEWYFCAGLGYPKRARIEGSGDGRE